MASPVRACVHVRVCMCVCARVCVCARTYECASLACKPFFLVSFTACQAYSLDSSALPVPGSRVTTGSCTLAPPPWLPRRPWSDPPARALASSVLPVPGSPSRSMPLGGRAPSLPKVLGSFRNCVQAGVRLRVRVSQGEG